MAKREQNVMELDNEAIKMHFMSVSKLTSRCFDSCVQDFGSKQLLPSESACSINCVVKYLSVTKRLNARLQEEWDLSRKPFMSVKGQGQ